MNITLEKVAREEEAILQNIMQFYLYEFSKYVKNKKLNEKGLFKPLNLEDYWTKSNYHPFFIKVEGELAGFVLVRSETDTEPNSIEQFFIMTTYNGKGIGRIAAKRIFDMFTGKWKVIQIKNNYPAQAFWRGVISDYTNDNYDERYDEEDERCSVQEFETTK
ncbi:GNAT family N-acetyltransferase [uncultured Brevibacillus sp.]|uniref:GNAT family N-acetyltransferase n=1 Tax=uncultured Brevibacillus sp. TaxID=169970 RepID=UPI00259A1DBE|nr:GNAT family N-acetyltransferase [uncultured Brevibacillus sp.]